MFTFTPLSLARLHVTRICDLHADNHSVMVSADVALKASMYFWMMMFIGYVAAAQLTAQFQFAFSRYPPPAA